MGINKEDLLKEDLELVKGGIILAPLHKVINISRKNSLWPMPFGLSCCAIEMMAVVAARYDLARFGAEAFRFTPRQCDLMIVAGTLTRKMAEAGKRIYDMMPEPKWVIAMGVCTTTGGMFNSYPVVQGIDHIIPVDVYIPGCPPRPDALIYGIMKIQEKVLKEKWIPGQERKVGHYRGRDPKYGALKVLSEGPKSLTVETDEGRSDWRKGYFGG
jgi:NADH-quinone oxidoreductase subunit B